MLPREEYIEQAYFFRTLAERYAENTSTQDLLAAVRDEVLATTKLPLAIDYMLVELKHSGIFAPAMQRLPHYFTPFQTFVVAEAENERGKFDTHTALEVLRREAEYRAEKPTRAGAFLYQFEAISRNRLNYNRGLDAMIADPIFDEDWRTWMMTLRRQIGTIDLADMIYVRSEHYQLMQRQRGKAELTVPVLFGEREGKIALANRRKDPLLLFAAMQRQLNYPAVPRRKPVDLTGQVVTQLARRVERLEHRLKFIEEEQREGIDLTKFYRPPQEFPED